ncbi:MAG: alpha/beta hydrolase [Alphaproteobacteria bacterium]
MDDRPTGPPAASRSALGEGLGLVYSLILAACSPARLVEAGRLLREIETGPAGAPARITLRYEIDGHGRVGDLYSPAAPARAGLVVVPGANPNGKDDPRLVAFATTMARFRFEVLVPELPGLRDMRVSSDDAGIVADALVALSRHRAAQGNATVGIVAISYSVGPAIISLLEDKARGAAHFLLGIGGYYDFETAITFFTTGCYRMGGGAWRRRAPDDYGRWFFARSNAGFLDDPGDRAALEAMAERGLADASADMADLVAALGPQGRTVHDLLANRDPGRVGQLIDALPPRMREEISKLDLRSRDLSALQTRLILVHGYDDPVVPETESMALAAAAPNARLYLLKSLRHVDPGRAGPVDKLKMLVAMHGVLAERDRVRRPGDTTRSSPLRLAARPGDGVFEPRDAK